MLADDDGRCPHGVGGALGKVGDIRALSPLIQTPATRISGKTATKALARVSDDRAIAPLIRRAEDESVFVRMGAADVLVSIGEAAVTC